MLVGRAEGFGESASRGVGGLIRHPPDRPLRSANQGRDRLEGRLARDLTELQGATGTSSQFAIGRSLRETSLSKTFLPQSSETCLWLSALQNLRSLSEDLAPLQTDFPALNFLKHRRT